MNSDTDQPTQDVDHGDEDKRAVPVLLHSPHFQILLNRSRHSIKAGKGLSRDEFWQAVEARKAKQPPDNQVENK